MKSLLQMSASLVCVLALAACSGADSANTRPATPATMPATLVQADIVVGTGAEAVGGKSVTVNYTGWLYDAKASAAHGAKFDSSIGKAAFTFKLGAGEVIAGWDQGVQGMKVGGKRSLIIPSSLGYGAAGAGASIPANAALVFEVEVLGVN